MAKQETFDDEQLNKYLKGTTTVGIVCKDGVVLGSDTRATMGYLIADKRAQKIYQVDEKLGMTTAGLVGDNQALIRIMKAQLSLSKMDGRAMTVKSAATLLANIMHGRRYNPFYAQIIVGGHDESGGHVFELDPAGGYSEKKVSSTGSGSPVAYGVLEEGYKGNLSVSDGVLLVIKALKSALERDAGTGNHINIVTITEKGYEKLGDDQTKKIIDSLKKETVA
ncbi:TPA: archaeal proteasome endopeptidase complex subunit beta [archaeon]|nr:archaeal proteasome endopeptidase complex subunit beta [Candidatus Naiadarchaeales archaeon SRR2090153.bin461]